MCVGVCGYVCAYMCRCAIMCMFTFVWVFVGVCMCVGVSVCECMYVCLRYVCARLMWLPSLFHYSSLAQPLSISVVSAVCKLEIMLIVFPSLCS